MQSGMSGCQGGTYALFAGELAHARPRASSILGYVNLVDLGAAAILVLAILSGFRSGVLPQLGGLAGAVAGGGLTIAALPLLRPQLETLDPPIRALAVLIGLVFAVAVGEAIGSTVGGQARLLLGRGILGALDQVAGAVLGLGQGLLVIWIAGGLLAEGPYPTFAAQAQRSIAVRTMNSALPPPTEIAGDLGRLLNASGLPDVFIGLEPLPAAPVDTPATKVAKAIAGAALDSTVRVTSLACRYSVTGTGFVVRRGYVVTNGHVIAGSRGVAVSLDGRKFDATPVLFDPSLDVALLYVKGLGAPALQLADQTPDRGAEGAAIGFPEGGPLTVIPGAVSASYTALGRDLYGETRVRRDIIELRAEINEGDSGGPFVLTDGTVGGVVFAESRSDPAVGYALTPTAVADRIAPALGRTSPVDTGDCIR